MTGPQRTDLAQDGLDRLWDFGDPAASLVRLEAAAAAESNVARQAELRTQQARALGLLDRFDEGLRLLDDIETRSVDSAAGAVRVLLERGRLHNSSGEAAAALPYFERAAALAESAGLEFLAVDAWHMVAIAAPIRADEATARGIVLAQSSADDRTKRWLVSLHNNLGWNLHEAERWSEALGEFEAAHAASLTYGTAQQEYVARWAIARCLRSMGRVDEALAIQRTLALEDPSDEYVREEIALLTAG